MKAGRFVAGWAVVEVSGDRPERVISAAAEAGIRFWDVGAPVDFSVTFCVRYAEAKALTALARRMGMDARTVRSGGLPPLWRSLRRRRALLAALLLCAGALGASRLFIWRVEIADTAGVPESVLREALRESGIDVGAFWIGFSQDLARNALLRKIPELRWATVNIRGGCAEVILRPARQTPQTEPEAECADIVAVRSGYITEVQALRGQALVTEGQTVLAGQTLISGEAVGRYESHGATRAIGTVRARTWYELTAAAPLETVSEQRGGRICTRWALIFGKSRINFYKGGSICASGCAKMTEETDLSVAGVFHLPLRIVCERVYETKPQTINAASPAETMQNRLTQRLRLALGDEGEILSLRFSQWKSEGWLFVTLHAECSESIGQTVPMTAAQIAAKSTQIEDNDP